MTEEEIISIVLDICIYKGDSDGLSKKEYQAIQGLVDLYNKEKEKSQKQDTEINKLKQENAELKHSITKATEIIDEYANETENDTKKLIEYQEKYLNNK